MISAASLGCCASAGVHRPPATRGHAPARLHARAAPSPLTAQGPRRHGAPTHPAKLNPRARCSVIRRATSSLEDSDDILLEPSDAAFQGIKAFVAGASGRTGREIVKALVARGVKVRAMVRDPATASKDLPGLDQGVEVVKGDVFKFQTLPRAMADCDTVLCATGSTSLADPLGPFSVDYQGTMNLVAAAKQAGVKRFVYVSSIGADDVLFPLNLAWGVLFWKKRAEEEIQRSGIAYTIVRPGGLLDKPRGSSGAEDEADAGNIVMKGADSFGLPPRTQPGSILRSQVAECCVQALVLEEAEGKVVEVIASDSAPPASISKLYSSVEP